MKKRNLLITLIGLSFGLEAQITDIGSNVGIGTTSPSAKLDVNGSIKFDHLASGHTNIQIGHDVHDRIYADNSSKKHYGGGMFFRVTPDPSLNIQHNYIDVMMLTDKGKVGIGKTNPNYKLDVVGDINTTGTLFFGNSNHGIIRGGSDIYGNDMTMYTGAGGINFATTGSPYGIPTLDKIKMKIANNGNIGIGTTSPSAKLDVNGSIKFDHLASGHTNIQIGHDVHDRIYADNSSKKHYGGGMFFRVTPDPSLNIQHNYIDVMMLTDKGKVGIGKTNPNYKLDVVGDINTTGTLFFGNSNHGIIRGGSDIYGNDMTMYTGAGGINFATTGSPYGTPTSNKIKMRITNNGNVGIGTTNPGIWRLAVNGNIRAKEIKVETGWSDFVFKKEYDLPTLEEVEKHINKKGHLKDIPSAKEVAEKGIYLGEMDSKLLQKIEELTLYTIQQQKEIIEQKEKIKKLEKEKEIFKSLAERLAKVEEQLKKKN